MSSKVAMRSLLRGKGHIGKEAVKFQFDIAVDKIHGLTTGPHVLKWTRGGKVAYTKPFQIPRKSVKVLDIAQKLSLLCTLYRSIKGTSRESSYDAKDSKLSLISYKDGKKNEKTIGKIHFNISEYAGIPSSSASVKFKLNNKTQVEVTISCTFVQISKGSGSSVGSGLSALSRSSSGEVEAGNDDFADNDSEDDEDMEEDIEECQDSPFSPVTPEPKQGPFDAARNVFELRENDSSPQYSAQPQRNLVTEAMKKFSGGNKSDHPTKGLEREKQGNPTLARKMISSTTDEEMAKADSSTSHEKPRDQGKGYLRVSTIGPKTKVKFANLESENETIKQELSASQKELKRVNELYKISEDVIVELRHAMSKKELEMKTMRGQHNQVLKRKISELNKELADVESRAAEAAENSEQRLKSIQLQVDSISRAKNRTEEELAAVQAELEILSTGKESAEIMSLRSKTEERLREVQSEYEAVRTNLSAEESKRKGLERKCRDLLNETSRLNNKLVAHEDHAENIKGTYDDLSHMYKELREQHVLVQQELQAYREGSGNLAFQAQDLQKDSEKSRRATRRNKLDKKGTNEASTGEDPQEIVELKMALSDANRKLVHLQTEKAESDRLLQTLSVDFEQMKLDLERSRSDLLDKSNICEEMKAKYLNVCEKGEESNRKSTQLQRRLTALENSVGVEIAESIPGGVPVAMMSLESAAEVKQKVANLYACAMEAKKTIAKMTEDLQEADQREMLYLQEINRLKDIINEITPRIKKAFEYEKERREAAEKELEVARSRAYVAEEKVEELTVKEAEYRKQVETLEAAVLEVETKAEAAFDSNDSLLSASRRELRLKQEEIHSLSTRIESLERELSAKKESNGSLSSRIRELEVENEIIKKQAQHELDMLKESARQDEVSSQRDKSSQAAQYKEEISNLRVVAESLQKELSESTQRIEEDAGKAAAEAQENRKLRQEVSRAQRQFEQELKSQQGVIDALHEKLREAAETNRRATEEAAEKANRLLEAIRGRKQAEKTLDEADLNRRELEEKIVGFRETIDELNIKLEESSRKREKGIQRAEKKVLEKEQLLLEAEEREDDLRLRIEAQEERFSSIRRELDDAVRKTVDSADRPFQATKELKVQREKLEHELLVLQEQLPELQHTIASLRGQLTESQNTQVALLAATAEDTSRTAAELEEAKAREQSYGEDIAKKNELIEELTSKLTDAVGKNAADSARAGAELSEANSREQSHLEEIKTLQQACNELEDELSTLRCSTAISSAELEAEASEATSREESSRFEAKRLREAVDGLETKLENTERDLAKAQDELKSTGALRGADKDSVTGLRANKAMADVLGIGDSLSSSNIRNLDVFEKITDARLLEMLVETKMQLAVAEEEKLQLEHLIRRIRDGDKHVQEKLAEQAASLEMKLTKANHMIDSMQDSESKSRSSRKGSTSGFRREESMMKGDQMQFFRDSRRRRSKSKSNKTKPRNRGGAKSSRLEAPQGEWDLGDDSHDGGSPGSGNTFCSTESSEME